MKTMLFVFGVAIGLSLFNYSFANVAKPGANVAEPGKPSSEVYAAPKPKNPYNNNSYLYKSRGANECCQRHHHQRCPKIPHRSIVIVDNKAS